MIQAMTKTLFESRTQAYREAAVGTVVARSVDQNIDASLPHDEFENGFAARSLHDHVINPFLRELEFPATTNPYLSSLRRGVKLRLPVPEGQRDRAGFEALARFVEYVNQAEVEALDRILVHLLYRFIRLREQANVELSRVERFSLEQYRRIMAEMIAVPSGGRTPFYITIAVLQALQAHFGLEWEVKWQEINAADARTRQGGDIDIIRDGEIVLSVEVTERAITVDRVRATFRAKISRHEIVDYIFVHTAVPPEDEAAAAARQYFAQGHHIAFFSVEDWAIAILGILGEDGRTIFKDHFLNLLDRRETPTALKLAWNNAVEMATTTI